MPLDFHKHISSTPQFRPHYEKALMVSGVVAHPKPRVYDVAGGRGIVLDMINRLRKSRGLEPLSDYHLSDIDTDALEEAGRKGAKTHEFDVRHGPITGSNGLVRRLPIQEGSVDHIFRMFPQFPKATWDPDLVSENAALLKKKGRITYLLGGADPREIRYLEEQGLTKVHDETIHLGSEESRMLNDFDNKSDEEWFREFEKYTNEVIEFGSEIGDEFRERLKKSLEEHRKDLGKNKGPRHLRLVVFEKS